MHVFIHFAYDVSFFFAGVFLDSPTEFTVDAKTVSPSGEGTVRAIVNNPSGVKNDTTVTNKGDGTYDVLYTPVEEGMMIYIFSDACTFK